MNGFVYGHGRYSTTAQDGDDSSSERSVDENANGESTDSSETDSFPRILASYSRTSSVENQADESDVNISEFDEFEVGEGEHAYGWHSDGPLEPPEENFGIDLEVLRIIYASVILGLALLIWLWFMF